MKPLLIFTILLGAGLALAQDPSPAQTKPTETKPTEAAKPADPQKPADTAKSADAAKPADDAKKTEDAPAPEPEKDTAGSIEIGYRARTDVRGSQDSYRSIVNLQSGIRLIQLDFTTRDPKHRFYDELSLRGNNWGDPYNTFAFSARKSHLYSLRGDYRNIAYFNAVPSYADPTIGSGYLLNENSFDIHRRSASAELEILPGTMFTPYFGFEHNSGTGRGVTDFVVTSNEYAVSSRLYDRTSDFRGGLRFSLRRLHITLEQGALLYRTDEDISQLQTNTGIRTATYLGNTLDLTGLQGGYGLRGTAKYTRAILSANPFEWLDVAAQFLFTQPSITSNYSSFATGTLVDPATLLASTVQTNLIAAQASEPHTSGNIAVEVHPFQRLRLINTITIDRMHSTGSITPDPSEKLSWNQNREAADVFVDLTRRITLQGGYRVVWGDGIVPPATLSLLPYDVAKLNRVSYLGGISAKPISQVSAHLDVEKGSADNTLFRTDLKDFLKVRAKVRYEPFKGFQLTGNYTFIDNDNPAAGIAYKSRVRDEALGLFWTPKTSTGLTLFANYDRYSYYSSILYVIPNTFATDTSLYRDNGSDLNVVAESAIPGLKLFHLAAGGDYFRSAGVRPTHYYQPLARLSARINKQLTWKLEWRWYGFTEPASAKAYYGFENFQTHAFVTSIRFQL